MAASIDAQILIWGIKRQSTPNRADMIPRAAKFFQKCQENRTPIFLPAQSLAEFLVGYTAEKRRHTLATLPKSFIIKPFDAHAAAIAADLQRDWNELKKIMVEYGTTRAHVKADINVIATSIAAGASHLYSEDGQMTALAGGRIIVVGLPRISEQQDLVGFE